MKHSLLLTFVLGMGILVFGWAFSVFVLHSVVM